MKLKTLFFATLNLMCSGAFAATNYWFVSVGGNDSANDGHSTNAPLRNIATAMQRMGPGDFVYIGNGTYREMMQVYTNHTGTSNANITLRPLDPNGVVVVKASDIITNWECVDSVKNIWRSPGFPAEVQQVFVHTNQTGATLDVYNPSNTNSMLEPGLCLNKIGMPNTATYTNIVIGGVTNYSYFWYENPGQYSIYPETILGRGWGMITNTSYKIENGTATFEGYNYFIPYANAVSFMATNQNTFYYSTNQYLYICLSDNVRPTNCAVEVSVRAFVLYGYNLECDHCINYQNLHFRHGNAISGANQSGPGVFIKSTFASCDFQWQDGTGLTIRNSTAVNCNFSNNGMLGLNPTGTSTITDCLIMSNNYRKITMQFIAAGIKVNGNLATKLHNPTTVEYCNVIGNHGVGVWFDTQRGTNEISVVRNCYIHDNSGAGIEMELSHNIYAYNNILATNGGGTGLYIGGSDNCRVWNNTFAYNHAFDANHAGVIKIACDYRADTASNSILNNIIYMSGATGDNTHCFNISVDTNIDHSDLCQVYSNIIDYNCYYRTDTTGASYELSMLRVAGNIEQCYYSLAGWQSYFAQDANSLAVDPGFILPNTTNFNLSFLSPLIDVGYDVSAQDTNDYYGFSRTNWNGCDIGAIECGYDGNSDSIDDDWEALYGVTDATSDGDADGLTAYAEWFRGSNPNSADTSSLTFYVNRTTGSSKYTGLSDMAVVNKHIGPKQYVNQALSITRKSGYINQDKISVYSYTNKETINLLTNNVLLFISSGSMDLR